MSVFLQQLQALIEQKLYPIERLLGPDYRITIVARYTGNDGKDADIVMTVDDLELAKATIDKMKARPSVPRD